MNMNSLYRIDPLSKEGSRLDTRNIRQLLYAMLQFADSLDETGWGANFRKDLSFCLAEILETKKEIDINLIPEQGNGQELRKEIREIVKSIRIRNSSNSNSDPSAELQYRLEPYFRRSLEEVSDHAPHLGMSIAFCRLFEKHYQRQHNELPRRFLRFYYENYLGLKPNPAEPDQVHVCFVPSADVRESATVPAGAALSAGRDEQGQEIVFRTENPVVLSPAKLACVHTLHTKKNKEKNQKNIELFWRTIKTPETKFPKSWPTFGTNDSLKNNYSKADFGFVITSPLFFLAEGERTISLKINLKDKKNVLTKEKFNDTILSLSTEAGWKDYWAPNNLTPSIKSPNDENTAKDEESIRFVLEEGWPAVTVLPEGNFKWPALRLLFTRVPKDKLEISSIEIKVEVKRVRHLHCYTSDGNQKSGKAFYSFGAQPEQGAYLALGQTEVFQKPLDSFTISWDWQGLPPDFENYFTGYKSETNQNEKETNQNEENIRLFNEAKVDKKAENANNNQKEKPEALAYREKYSIKAEWLIDKKWHSLKGEKKNNSAESKNEERTENEERFMCTLEPVEGYLKTRKLDPETWHFGEPEEFSDLADNSYLKITLATPEHPFGHGRYQQALGEYGKKMAEPKDRISAKLPNPPFSPSIQKISIDYEAKSKDKSWYQFHHIHPSGNVAHQEIGNTSLLPRQNYLFEKPEDKFNRGILFLGIRQANPGQALNLFFQLQKSTLAHQRSTSQRESIKWYQFSPDGENEKLLIKDNTDDLSKSGVISFITPARKQIQHPPVINPELTWIIGIFDGEDLQDVPATTFLEVNGTRCRRELQAGQERIDPIPAGKIKMVIDNYPFIQSVIQPFPSYFGRHREDDRTFFQRISRRLLHNRRAWRPRDFEELVYQEFKEVDQVKCIESDGIVRVVLIPSPEAFMEESTPSFSTPFLNKVKNFLKKHHSPFLKVEVMNPHYAWAFGFYKVQFKVGKGKQKEKLEKDISLCLNKWKSNKGLAKVPIGAPIDVERVKKQLNQLDYIESIDLEFGYIFNVQEENRDILFWGSSSTQHLHFLPWGVILENPDGKHFIIENEETIPDIIKKTDYRPDNYNQEDLPKIKEIEIIKEKQKNDE
jgi:hypothetical protein